MRALIPARLICIFSLVIICSGCKRHEEQYETEAHAASGIIRLLTYYDIEHPDIRPTNLSQLFPVMEQGYPHQWDRQFRTYGKHAGFTNSIYEKYIFFPPRLTSDWTKGELVLMNAYPYPAGDGKMQRTVVSKSTNGYHREPLREDLVQRMLNDAGIVEPKPPSMPPPPPPPPESEYNQPLFSRIRIAVVGFLRSQGLSGEVAWTIWWILLSVPVIALATVGLWMWRQRRNSNRNLAQIDT